MNEGKITRYTEEHYHITAYVETKSLKAAPIYPDWTNFVSQRSVRAIAVAAKSRHIWLATWGGVLCWNPKAGTSYWRYSSEHGLAGNTAACICVDQKEYVWTGHTEGGLSYFDGQHWQVYSHLQQKPIHVVSPAVHSGGIWAAAKDMVYYISSPNNEPIPVALKGHNSVLEVLTLLDADGNLLLGNTWGLFRICMGHEPEKLTLEPMQTCTALTKDRNGRVWVGMQGGVYYLENKQLTGPITPDDTGTEQHILALAGGQDQVWVLTTIGLAQLIDDHWYWISNPPQPTLKLHTIAADFHESYVWVGTDRLLAGIQFQGFNKSRWDLDLLPFQPEDELNNIGQCIAAQAFNNRVWIGTAKGLIAFSPNDEWNVYPEWDNVRTLCEEASLIGSNTSRNLWMLTYPYGVGQWNNFNLPDFRVPQPPGLPLIMVMGQNSHLYVLTGRALWQLDKEKWKAIAETPPISIRSLVQIANGQWYLGTSQGVYYLAREGWRFAGEQPGPLRAGVRAMTSMDDQLWVATETGLWKRQNETWISYVVEPEESLSDVRTLALSTYPGELWLAREKGVVRYNSLTKRQSLCYTPINSGLASCRVTALAEINDSLWIVTQAGICRLKLRIGEGE